MLLARCARKPPDMWPAPRPTVYTAQFLCRSDVNICLAYHQWGMAGHRHCPTVDMTCFIQARFQTHPGSDSFENYFRGPTLIACDPCATSRRAGPFM